MIGSMSAAAIQNTRCSDIAFADGRFWWAGGERGEPGAVRPAVEALAAFVAKNRTAPAEAVYREACKRRRVVPGQWAAVPLPTRLAFTTFTTCLVPLLAECDALEAAAALADQVEIDPPDRGLFKRTGSRGTGADEVEALAHGVFVMESAGRDHLPVPLAVLKRIIAAAAKAEKRPCARTVAADRHAHRPRDQFEETRGRFRRPVGTLDERDERVVAIERLRHWARVLIVRHVEPLRAELVLVEIRPLPTGVEPAVCRLV